MSTSPGSTFDAMAFTSLGPERVRRAGVARAGVRPSSPEEPPLKPGSSRTGCPSWSSRARAAARARVGGGLERVARREAPRGWSAVAAPGGVTDADARGQQDGGRATDQHAGAQLVVAGSWRPPRRPARPEASGRPATTTCRGPTAHRRVRRPGRARVAAQGAHGVAAAQAACPGVGSSRAAGALPQTARPAWAPAGCGASSAAGAGGVTAGRAMAWAGSSGTAASWPVSDSHALADPPSGRSCPRSSDPPSGPATPRADHGLHWTTTGCQPGWRNV